MLHRLLLPLILWFAQCLPALAAPSVWVVVSGSGREYQEAAEVIKTGLGGVDLQVKAQQDLPPSGTDTIVVALGTAAYQSIADQLAAGKWPKAPVVAAMVPRTVLESGRRRYGSATTGVWLDQPLQRQLSLIKLAFGSTTRVGLLIGPESRQWQPALERAAQEQGLSLNAYRVDNEAQLSTELQRLLGENDMLLALPDPMIFNAGTVQNILLATYRQRIPMMGFSPAYVRAGATLGLYSAPSQIGIQVARIVRQYLQTGTLPAPQGPQDFQVGVNASVSRSLGLRLSEDALRIDLQNREGQ